MKIISLIVGFFSLSGLWFSQLSYADEASDDYSVEYKIKAGYLYNFTKFVTWPEDKDKNFNLCILGDDPFGDLINPIEQRSAFGRSIKLFRLDSLEKGLHCHLLFASSSINTNLFKKNILITQDFDKTLTVGDGKGFASQGGMIGFVNRDGKIKLQINLAAIRQSGLKVSAKLLEVAELVEESKHD